MAHTSLLDLVRDGVLPMGTELYHTTAGGIGGCVVCPLLPT